MRTTGCKTVCWKIVQTTFERQKSANYVVYHKVCIINALLVSSFIYLSQRRTVSQVNQLPPAAKHGAAGRRQKKSPENLWRTINFKIPQKGVQNAANFFALCFLIRPSVRNFINVNKLQFIQMLTAT